MRHPLSAASRSIESLPSCSDAVVTKEMASGTLSSITAASRLAPERCPPMRGTTLFEIETHSQHRRVRRLVFEQRSQDAYQRPGSHERYDSIELCIDFAQLYGQRVEKAGAAIVAAYSPFAEYDTVVLIQNIRQPESASKSCLVDGDYGYPLQLSPPP